MTCLIDLKAPKHRFARSINVERDAGRSRSRVTCRSDERSRASTAWRAHRRTHRRGRDLCHRALRIGEVFPCLLDRLRSSRRRAILLAERLGLAQGCCARTFLDVSRARSGRMRPGTGFIRCVVTAQREPVAPLYCAHS